MTTNPQTRRQTVEYFLQTRQPDDTWEDSSSFMDDLDWARQRLDVRQEKYPAFEHRIARRATTVVVEPVDAATASGPSAPVDRAELRDRIAKAVKSVRVRPELTPITMAMIQAGSGFHLTDEEAEPLANAVLPVLPAPVDRGAVLAEAADVAERVAVKRHEQHEIEREQGALDVMTVLRRMADEEQQPDAPADPWSISYHRLGGAENNPAVCICGLGPEAVLHNEPPHRFNGRPKPGMPPVYGICTDCHHHETAACHTTDEAAAVAQPVEEQQPETQARVVAYRSPGTRTLYCVICARQETGWQPVTDADEQAVCDFCGGRVHAVAARTLGDVVARHMTAEAQHEPVCICGHPTRLHHEDACLLTGCGCADVLEVSALPEALEAVLTKRFTELGNQFAEMRLHEQGPDGWPSSHPVGPHQVAEVLRELLATDAPAAVAQPVKEA